MATLAERNCACVSCTDHGCHIQYGFDGAHEEAGLGRELAQPASLSLRHPVILNSADMDHMARGSPSSLSSGETHDAVHGSFINLMKLPNVETLIFLVPASNHFIF